MEERRKINTVGHIQLSYNTVTFVSTHTHTHTHTHTTTTTTTTTITTAAATTATTTERSGTWLTDDAGAPVVGAGGVAEVGGGAEGHVTLAARALHGLHEERAQPLAKERPTHRQGAGTAGGSRIHTLGYIH